MNDTSLDNLVNDLVQLSIQKQNPTLYFNAITKWFEETQKTLFKDYVTSELENSVDTFVFNTKMNGDTINDDNLKNETQQIIERATSKAKKRNPFNIFNFDGQNT